MTRICVFCGSSPGARHDYVAAARELGGELARRRIDLVYGGARAGTMAALSSGALESGGHVIGVMPRDLVDREMADTRVPDLRIVGAMHERKALMAELADAFIALPGGLGTLDELFEMLSWAQLGWHAKPCGLLNVSGYYDELIRFLRHAAGEGFIAAAQVSALAIHTRPGSLIDALERLSAAPGI